MSWPPDPLVPADPALSDGTVVVDALTDGDAADIVEACNDPEIARWLPVPVPYTHDDAVFFLGLCAEQQAAGRQLQHAVRRTDTGRFAGLLGTRFLRDRTIEFGYWTAPGSRREGLMTRALRLLTAHAFATWGVHRIEILTAEENTASSVVAGRAGFRPEGTRRNAMTLSRSDEPVAAEVHSLIPTDPMP